MVTEKIKLRDFYGCSNQKGASVCFATTSTTSHVNMLVRDHDERHAGLCLHPDDARELRDQLLELYPLDVVIPEQSEEQFTIGKRTVIIKPDGEIILSIPVFCEEVEEG